MDVLVLIDKLDDLVHNAKPVPLTDQVRVDKEEIYDLLDQMRATIPEEIKQARWIVKERQEMLAEAKREAERIVKEARERQNQLVSERRGHQAGRARRRGHHRGRARPRARDPPRRRGLRRRDPQHARGQPLEVHRGRPARARAPAGQGRAGRSGLAGQVGREGHALTAEHPPALAGDADPLEAGLSGASRGAAASSSRDRPCAAPAGPPACRRARRSSHRRDAP